MTKVNYGPPLHRGALIVSILHTLSYVISAGAMWAYPLGAHTTFRTSSGQIRQVNLGTSLNAESTVAMMIWAIVLTVGALCSPVGIIILRTHQSVISLDTSAITHHVLILQAYLFVMAALLGAHLVMGLVTVAILGGSEADFIGWCTKIASDSDAVLSISQWSDGCQDGYRIVLFTAIGALVVPLLVNLYAYWTWRDYGRQLRKDVERDLNSGLAALKKPHRQSKATGR